jgi:hypothetical protein
MKPNELRLGNLFYPINREGYIHLPIEIPFKIHSIGLEIEAYKFDQIPAQLEQIPKFNLRDLSEISITDEWLIKFGFEIFPWRWVKKSKSDFGIRLNIKTYSYEVEGNTAVKLEYVHQLQNLYFVLTGEELELSPVEYD